MIDVPVNDRPQLTRDEIKVYAEKLTEVAKWMQDRGMPMAYHHHMGSMIESEDDVNWLMEFSGAEVNLCFDTGHLLFGGGDIARTMDRWMDRIHHVHFKDIRPEIVKDVRENNRSFDAVIAGAFTVPGDGCIDFLSVENLRQQITTVGLLLRRNKIQQRRHHTNIHKRLSPS